MPPQADLSPTSQRKYRTDEGRDSEQLIKNSPDHGLINNSGKTNSEFISETVEESDESIAAAENNDSSHDRTIIMKKPKDQCNDTRARLPTPPPPSSSKNVSFGELHEQRYLEQPILPPPVQFIPKHRHQGM